MVQLEEEEDNHSVEDKDPPLYPPVTRNTCNISNNNSIVWCKIGKVACKYHISTFGVGVSDRKCLYFDYVFREMGESRGKMHM